ncbi:DUF547 domain-containing protein [Hymenobacter saemangeumensis]|uniref:DUF547 domain-containing protein n=1 Tax=Hymenobacter saemangeumensis TaxID=1084522 RepID=A0ABP8HWH4_9BACT
MNKLKLFSGLGLLLLAFAVAARTTLLEAPGVPQGKPGAGPVDHRVFDRLLKKHVNAEGRVNYKGFKAEQEEFNKYLSLLSKNPPAASWSKNEQMAYWINAYNAYTIRLILDHYPLKSIKDIGPKIQVPFVNTPWAKKFFTIGGEEMSLDNIEHGTLRKKYNDPRIHFALVCASISCPRLRNEAYTAEQLDRQLDEQGRDFLSNASKNKVGKDKALLSKYFDWYKGDWEKNGQNVVSWVNKYSPTKIDKNTKIGYLDYNWKLNEQ